MPAVFVLMPLNAVPSPKINPCVPVDGKAVVPTVSIAMFAPHGHVAVIVNTKPGDRPVLTPMGRVLNWT